MWIANEGMKRCSTSVILREPWIGRTMRASRWLRGKEPACQCQRHICNPWSRKIAHPAEQPSPWATTAEPVLWNLGALTPQPTCCNCSSPRASNLCSPPGEAVAAKEWPLIAMAREESAQQQDLVQPRIRLKPQWAITTHLLRWEN